MTTPSKIRILSAVILACAAGIILFGPTKKGFENAALRACLEAKDKPTKIETCTTALQQVDTDDTLRGEAAFQLAMVTSSTNEDRAVELYTQTIALYPDRTSAFYNRGLLYQEAKEYALAAADFTTVIERITPENAAKYSGAYRLRAHVFEKQERFSEAMPDVDQALAYDPDDIRAIQIKADILSAQEKYSEALVVLDNAIAEHPGHSSLTHLWKDRAWTNSKLGKIDEAFKDINKALELGDNSAWAWYWRGRLHSQIDDRKAAYADYQRSLAVDPHFCRSIWAVNRWTNALVESAENMPLESRDFIDDLLTEHPEDILLLRGRYLTSLIAGEFETALQDINRVIEVAKYPDVPRFYRARLYKDLGQYDLALADLTLLIERKETQSKIIQQVNQEMTELINAGKKCVAQDLSSKGMELIGLHRAVLRQKMVVHAEVFDWESVIVTLDLMIEDDPDDVGNWRKRGITQQELDRPEDALESYDKAIQLIESGEAEVSSTNNGFANTYDYRGSIHQSQHRVEQASSDFDNALELGDSAFVKAFQLRMQKAGHYEGPLNGNYDKATEDAMKGCASDVHCIDPEL